MALQTSVANSLDNAGDEAKLDRNVKKIFSHEAVLAPLMRMCIPEFAGEGVEQRVQHGRSDQNQN